jgi:hypothetical protein
VGVSDVAVAAFSDLCGGRLSVHGVCLPPPLWGVLGVRLR